MSETNETGRKLKTNVIAAGTKIATQTIHYGANGPVESLWFEHAEASGMSSRSSWHNGLVNVWDGMEGSPAETDPMGGNVGMSEFVSFRHIDPSGRTERWAYLSGMANTVRSPDFAQYEADGLSIPTLANEDPYGLSMEPIMNRPFPAENALGGSGCEVEGTPVPCQMAEAYTKYGEWANRMFNDRYSQPKLPRSVDAPMPRINIEGNHPQDNRAFGRRGFAVSRTSEPAITLPEERVEVKIDPQPPEFVDPSRATLNFVNSRPPVQSSSSTLNYCDHWIRNVYPQLKPFFDELWKKTGNSKSADAPHGIEAGGIAYISMDVVGVGGREAYGWDIYDGPGATATSMGKAFDDWALKKKKELGLRNQSWASIIAHTHPGTDPGDVGPSGPGDYSRASNSPEAVVSATEITVYTGIYRAPPGLSTGRVICRIRR